MQQLQCIYKKSGTSQVERYRKTDLYTVTKVQLRSFIAVSRIYYIVYKRDIFNDLLQLEKSYNLSNDSHIISRPSSP